MSPRAPLRRLRWRLAARRRLAPGLAALLLLLLLPGAAGCGPGPVKPKTAEAQGGAELPAVQVSDDELASAVHRLLRDGKQTPERAALLAGAVRRQLAHAAEHFTRGDRERGTDAVTGALYLLRPGEARPDMFDAASTAALAGAIARHSASGDEGRALALLVMQRALVAPGSAQRAEIDAHLDALGRWISETHTGEDMEKLAADKRAVVARALLEPSQAALQAAAQAVGAWIDRAVEYNVQYRDTGAVPPHEEAIEALRALQGGGMEMAALYLRHGRARAAFDALLGTPARQVVRPHFFALVRAAAGDGTAGDWRALAGAFASGERSEDGEPLHLDPGLLQAAIWGTAVEAYRRDPTSPAIGQLLAELCADLALPEVAPLLLADALGPRPAAALLSSALGALMDTLSAELDRDAILAARRIFASSRALLELGDRDEYRGRVKPSTAELRQMLAAVELRSGNADGARALMVAALQVEPTVWGYTMLAMIERQVGNAAAALAHALRAAALPAAEVLRLDSAQAKLLAFELLQDQGAHDRAATELDGALELTLGTRRSRLGDSAQVRAEGLLARILDRYGEQGGAARAMERALDIAGRSGRMLGPTLVLALQRDFVQRDLGAARAAVQRGIDAQLDGDDLVYGALWLMLLERQLGEQPDGKVERVLGAAVEGEGWTAALARWARGSLSDAELRAAARSYSQRIEALFYVAMSALAAGLDGAREDLRRVAQSPLIDLVEVHLAREVLGARPRARRPGRFEVP
ncbi:MAG: hypothetical protein HY744_25730 [Deltaproteobacteria bacterium]|nr:hypothetical protein [Deltaproteobacteria bacterium]